MRIRSHWTPEQRCEAALADNTYHRKWTDMRCAYHRMYLINGKALCGRHSSLELLSLAVAAGTITRIPPHPKPQHGPVAVVSADWKP